MLSAMGSIRFYIGVNITWVAFFFFLMLGTEYRFVQMVSRCSNPEPQLLGLPHNLNLKGVLHIQNNINNLAQGECALQGAQSRARKEEASEHN